MLVVPVNLATFGHIPRLWRETMTVYYRTWANVTAKSKCYQHGQYLTWLTLPWYCTLVHCPSVVLLFCFTYSCRLQIHYFVNKVWCSSLVPVVVISHKSSGVLWEKLAFLAQACSSYMPWPSLKVCILDIMALLEGRSLEEPPDAIQLISISLSFTFLIWQQIFSNLVSQSSSYKFHYSAISTHAHMTVPHYCNFQ